MKISFYNSLKNLKKREWVLWISSMTVIAASSLIAGSEGILNTIASLVGVTALIFVAKGDALGQLITIIFSVLYGIISVKFKYYGETITYLCMSAPAAFVSLIVWIKNPYKDSNEVKVDKLTKSKLVLTVAVSFVASIVFYFILKTLGNANLIVSTVSIFTSAFACMLLILRSPYYAVAYASNDIVLIILWILATMDNIKYLPMILCFTMFLANDLYGFYNWQKMKNRQV
ncbi:MAG: nicotinamide riboside transporter PnuC [Eubacterium sp.]